MALPQSRDPLYARIAELNAIIDAKDAEIARLKGLLDDGLVTFPGLGLTVRQTALLAALYAARGMVRKDYIFEVVWGCDSDTDPKIVDVTVHHLRRKLRRHGIAIRTVWGFGFLIETVDREALSAFAVGSAS